MELFNMIGSIFQVPDNGAQNSSLYYTPKESFKVRPLRGKLRKNDISSPSNFRHVTHVGFNSLSGLDSSTDKDLKSLFDLAGISEEHLRDSETSRKIFRVLEKQGGMEAVRRETRRMTTVERTNTPCTYRSRSSTLLTPSKRPSYSLDSSPHSPKIPSMQSPHTPFSYLPTVAKLPTPLQTPPSFLASPAMEPISLRPSVHTQKNPPVPPRPRKKIPTDSVPQNPLLASNSSTLKRVPHAISSQETQIGPLCSTPVQCPLNKRQNATIAPPPALGKELLDKAVSKVPPSDLIKHVVGSDLLSGTPSIPASILQPVCSNLPPGPPPLPASILQSVSSNLPQRPPPPPPLPASILQSVSSNLPPGLPPLPASILQSVSVSSNLPPGPPPLPASILQSVSGNLPPGPPPLPASILQSVSSNLPPGPPPPPPQLASMKQTGVTERPSESPPSIKLASGPPPPPPLPVFMALPLCSQGSSSAIAKVKSETPDLGANVDDIRFQQNIPSFFLSQIRKGVQLKTVCPTAKVDSSHNSDMVNALINVIRERHKAFNPSDEETVDTEDDWED